jgi:hypothetical protein
MRIMRRGRVGAGDRRAVLALLAVPVAVFVVPALFGHPIVTGDNEIQNLPLRALAGEDLRHGHLPLWNPYIWSGSPLLGGLNAGALYPFTWVFAVLPVLTAWTLNLVVVYVTAALGLYALLRQQRLRPFASGLGAASFAFAGSMSAQVVHLGIVQGTSWIPWMLLVEQRLARRLLAPAAPTDPSVATEPGVPEESADSASVWRRVVVLGMLGGLVLLTGEPRAMANAAVVVGLAALWHLVRRRASWRGWWAFALCFVLSTALAAALGAVQLVPGWSFISHSQRAQSTVSFFGSGSLPVRWSLLMLVPDLMGGTGYLHQPAYFSHYNLPEITGYVGILPLMALTGLLARSFGRWRHPEARRWLPWFGLVVVGLLLAYGTYTPLGRYLARVPFFGDLRLQSRNIVIAGLGLAVLLAYWLDTVIDPVVAQIGRVARGITLLTVVPAVAVGALLVTALVWPATLESWMGATGGAVDLGRSLAPSFGIALAVAVVAGAVGLGYRRFSPRARRWVVGSVVAFDLILFTATSVTELNLRFTTAQIPTAATAVPLQAGTRFAIVDPENQFLTQLSSLGQNDLNTLVHGESAQGYGSLTDNGYQGATGTRTHNTLNPCAVAQGAFVPLDLGVVLTLPANLMRQVDNAASPVEPPVPENGCGTTTATSNRRVWWFGRRLVISRASVAFASDAPAPDTLRIGVLLGSGKTKWVGTVAVSSAGDRLDIDFPVAVAGSGLVVAGAGGGPPPPATTVTSVAGVRFVLDGGMQSALRQAAFRFTGYREGVAVFRTSVVRPPVWIEGPGATSSTAAPLGPDVGTARRQGNTAWGAETDVVTARRPVTLVRSEAFADGWQASARDAGTGRTQALEVIRLGLVEAVRLPAGRSTVTWTYRPRSAAAGAVGSLAGGLVVVAAGGSWLWRRRTTRARRRGAGASSRATTRA